MTRKVRRVLQVRPVLQASPGLLNREDRRDFRGHLDRKGLQVLQQLLGLTTTSSPGTTT